MEVLISMFVLLFGLMGVAAIFPVGSHYVVEGEKWDNASLLSQQAFEEIEAWGMMNPEVWVYSTEMLALPVTNPHFVIQPTGSPAPGRFNDPDPGGVFVIDPLGAAYGLASVPNFVNLDLFPYGLNRAASSYWPVLPSGIMGNTWPVRRVTLLDSQGMMSINTAETIFRLRDDLSYDMPDQRDRPGQQLWRTDGANLLSRQFRGDYSWLATIAPLRRRARNAIQPEAKIPDEYYDVSVVVFHKRQFGATAPTPGNPGDERLIQGQFLGQREIVLYGNTPELVDDAVKDIGARNWIAVMGVNWANEMLTMKWYRILAMDDESVQLTGIVGNLEGQFGRYITLAGPDWPENPMAGVPRGFQNLQVAILPGVIDVVTRPMQLHWGNPPINTLTPPGRAGGTGGGGRE